MMASGGDDSFASFDKSYETFSEMNLNERLLAGIFGYGFEKPSEVQQKGIVPLCEGLDVLVQAESEPGRTATFCTAILQRHDCHLDGCQCIVFAPTTFLVEEIVRFLRAFGTHLNDLQVYACGDGFSVLDDLRYFLDNEILTKVVHVVVGTPPSVLGMFEGKTLRPDHIKMVILDDGYNATTFWMDQIRKISQLLPSRVQVGVFAETISPENVEAFHLLRNRDKFKSSLPVKIVVKQNVRKIEGMTHYAASVPEFDDMPKILLKLLHELPTDSQCVIFVNNPYWADHLLFIIWANSKLRARVMHPNMDQTYRDIIMRDFRARSINVLITPDNLARGFDMEVPLIINYEMTGFASLCNERTAHFGRDGGIVVSIVHDDFVWYLDIIHEECDVVFEDLSTGGDSQRLLSTGLLRDF